MKHILHPELKEFYDYDEILEKFLEAGWAQTSTIKPKDKLIACIALIKEIKQFNTIYFDLSGELVEKALNSYNSKSKVCSDINIQLLLFELKDKIIDQWWEEIESDLITKYEYRIANKRFNKIKESENE